jgi:hypothetical protein
MWKSKLISSHIVTSLIVIQNVNESHYEVWRDMSDSFFAHVRTLWSVTWYEWQFLCACLDIMKCDVIWVTVSVLMSGHYEVWRDMSDSFCAHVRTFRAVNSLQIVMQFLKADRILDASVTQFLAPWNSMNACGRSCYKANASCWQQHKKISHITYFSTKQKHNLFEQQQTVRMLKGKQYV